MTTYYTETFDGDCTPPALPANWSTYLNSGAVVTSTTVAHSGTQSLKITPAANKSTYCWNTTPDTNYGNTVLDFWFNANTVVGVNVGIGASQRYESNPGTTAGQDGNCISVWLSVFGSSTPGNIITYFQSGTSGVS